MNENERAQMLFAISYDELPALINTLTLSLNEWIRIAFLSIKMDHIGLLDRLLESNCITVLVENENGYNLLHAAVEELSEDGVDYLLDNAGYREVEILFLATNNQGSTPLDMAVRTQENAGQMILTSLLHASFVQGSSSSPVMHVVKKTAEIALPSLTEYINLIIRGKEVLSPFLTQ